MMKITAAPDSFKGTVTSSEAGLAVISAFLDAAAERWENPPDTSAVVMADGGEGTTEALIAHGGEIVSLGVCGPDPGQRVGGFFGVTSGGEAVVELAAAAALPQSELRDPEKTTTYGVGQLISAALDRSPKKLILALGGSATNDGGCGMAAALGVRFLDASGNGFVPVGGTLERLASIDMSGLDGRIKDIPVEVMCDVTSPLCGEKGAAAVFAPQKGASPEAVRRLDAGLMHLARVWSAAAGYDADEILSLPGGGAAGGCGAGAVIALGASLRPGADVVLDAAGFDGMLSGCDLVVTGEGKFDASSLSGKAVGAVARRCASKGVPCVVLAGQAEPTSADILRKAGITAVFSTQRAVISRDEIRARARDDIYETALNVARLFAV